MRKDVQTWIMKEPEVGQVKQSSSYEGGWGEGVEVGASQVISRKKRNSMEMSHSLQTMPRKC